MTHRTPRTLAAATALLERYAALEAQLATIEARRTRLLARANAAADAKAGPLVAELAEIVEKAEPWWLDAGRKLAGQRKSIELGGCMIGSRAGKPKLGHGFENDDKAVEALRATRYGKQTTRVKYWLDRQAVLKLLQLEGKAGETIAELGFTIDQGERFFVDRVEQAGTIAG